MCNLITFDTFFKASEVFPLIHNNIITIEQIFPLSQSILSFLIIPLCLIRVFSSPLKFHILLPKFNFCISPIEVFYYSHFYNIR
ncbi:hypothetical protein BLOT_002991 [Blomia tropicalis]|nr:hypothetical protein BLOT_002991 [Blomia tropicalis]